MSQENPQDPNPNTPQAWDSLWKGIGLAQKDDAWIMSRLTLVAKLIPPGASVIDLAAGPGFIRHKLTPDSLYTPVDFSSGALHLCQVPGLQATCTNVPTEDHSYHTVLAMEILEHLDDTHALIIETIRIARHQVIVTVPNDRLPPEQFNMHRRTYTEPFFTDFLRDFKQFAHVLIFRSAANLIGQCLLKAKDALL